MSIFFALAVLRFPKSTSCTLRGAVNNVLFEEPSHFRGYQSQTTKLPKLIFSALVGDDGTHNVRFERVLRT
jgi:hypothetical protein